MYMLFMKKRKISKVIWYKVCMKFVLYQYFSFVQKPTHPVFNIGIEAVTHASLYFEKLPVPTSS